MTVNQTAELILESPPVTTDDQNSMNLSDAMDKVVNHEDVSFTEPTNWLKFCDCMDLITGRVITHATNNSRFNCPGGLLHQIKK